MLHIAKRNPEKLPALRHGAGVFRDALEKVRAGERRFHVTDPEGKVPDYDLVYTPNMELFPEQIRGMILEKTKGELVYADYTEYDGESPEYLCLGFLRQFDRIEIERADEYSVAVARAALAYTELPVFCADARILWFLEDAGRVTLQDPLPAERGPKALRIVPDPFELGFMKRDWSLISSVAAFQNLFFWQAMTRGRKGPFRYLEVVLTGTTGIGGVMSHVSRFSALAKEKGLLTFLRPGCTRYPERMLCKYLRFPPKPSDADDGNTLVTESLHSVFTTTWAGFLSGPGFDEHIFTDRFLGEMREYADAVLGGRRTLGVLARGTDFLTGDFGPERKQANAEQMFPVLREWLAEGNYDRIFLATEDREILDRMRAAFPGRVIAVAQERISAADLREKGVTLISDYEKRIREGQAYLDALEDTTVSYFYALYLLSRCDAFLCSGRCNGWDTVRSLNGGRFGRERMLNVSAEGEPGTEKWKEIRPVDAGMLARGSWPASRPYFASLRFDLKEPADGPALRRAWEKTLKAYPYMGYAIGTRKARLVYLENPLPFVFDEADAAAEPSGRAGNFHTVTFAYRGNTLRIRADLVAADITGLRLVLETFFRRCYSGPDGQEDPPVDGPVPGQEDNAFLLAEAEDPAKLLSRGTVEKGFVPGETGGEGLFPRGEDCGAFCIAVPAEELRERAAALGGTVLTASAVFLARAIARLHPENALPVVIRTPLSVRETMGNTHSLLPQSVNADYAFTAKDLAELSDAELNSRYRAFLDGFRAEGNIRKMCAVSRGICEGNVKAYAGNVLEKITLRQMEKRGPMIRVCDAGTLRAGKSGGRVRLTEAHGMPEKGITLVAAEAGGTVCLDWYQGMKTDRYARAMAGLMTEAGLENVTLERVL